jgi:hypothetical protein
MYAQPAEAQAPLGTASCSARACHGGLEAFGARTLGRPVFRNEYTTWLRLDPHARASDALDGDWARAIAKNLEASDSKAVPAHDDGRCLACHAAPAPARSAQAASIEREGVGCEGCHGSAKRWLSEHVSDSFLNLPPTEKQARYGMTATRALSSRAQLCAGCHVGAPAAEGMPLRDVNHDLIAAGHPRLEFEFAESLARMPKHWVERNGTQPLSPTEAAAFQVRAWLVGQLAVSEASLNLQADRAAHTERPWPEFAAYDCFACHHDLAQPSWRQALVYGSRKPGAPAWGTWEFALLPRALAFPRPEVDAEAAMSSIDRLRSAMSQTRPGRDQIPALARTASAAIAKALPSAEAAAVDFDRVRVLAETLIADAGASGVATYDHARQAYLAASAFEKALRGATTKADLSKLQEELSALSKRLELPSDFNSPRGYDPGSASSGGAHSAPPR